MSIQQRIATIVAAGNKITRDAFIYLAPKPGQEKYFAQCGPCQLFVPGDALANKSAKGRCLIHGAKLPISEEDSCGFMIPWPNGKPEPKIVKLHAAEINQDIAASVTPEQSGLVSRLVQCHRCKFPTTPKVDKCGLFIKLNQSLPDIFALDENIQPNACCNAQEPK